MMGVPTFYTRLLSDERLSSELVAHMRLFISGSAPMLADTHQAFQQCTGHEILERYGMTETLMIASNPYVGARQAGWVGASLPGITVRITDQDTGATLPPGSIGMIEVKGPNVFQGYWQMPEKTRSEFRDDGFFLTGDLGQMDSKGNVQIVGRSKDLIITGGFNVYPKEVELLLDDDDAVMESAVIGVPHPDFGEGVVGLVVAAPGRTPDLAEIQESLASDLAKFKQPKELLIVESLPRNSMGKVQKNVLRHMFKGHFQE